MSYPCTQATPIGGDEAARHCAAVDAQERSVLCLTAPEGRASPRAASAAPTAQAAAPTYARHVSERTLL